MAILSACLVIATINLGIGRATWNSLWLSENLGSDIGNCTNQSLPCKTWSYVADKYNQMCRRQFNEMNPNSTALYIDSGNYNIYQTLNRIDNPPFSNVHDMNYSKQLFIYYKVGGNYNFNHNDNYNSSMAQAAQSAHTSTVLQTFAPFINLFRFHGNSFRLIYIATSVEISQIVYSPLTEYFSTLLVTSYLSHVKLSNITVDGDNTTLITNYSCDEYCQSATMTPWMDETILIYIKVANSLTVEDMTISNVRHDRYTQLIWEKSVDTFATVDDDETISNSNYVFYVFNVDNILLKGIQYVYTLSDSLGLVNSCKKYMYFGHFAYFWRNQYSMLRFEDILIEYYPILHAFHLKDNHNSNVSFYNIELNGVYGEYLFCFEYNTNMTTLMNHVTVNGLLIATTSSTCNDEPLIDKKIFYFGKNTDCQLNMNNSNFVNIMLSASGIAFNIDSYYINTNYVKYQLQRTITIVNTIFSNITTKNNKYGLIYISGNGYHLMIDNCTFSSNKNFVGIIHCTTHSNCNISIKNSKFSNNDGLCENGQSVSNGIYLENEANATVVIKNSTFTGIPWIHADSTSNVTIDSVTRSTMYETNATSTINVTCDSPMVLMISNYRYRYVNGL